MYSPCTSCTCSLNLFLCPSQEQQLMRWHGHFVFAYPQTSLCSAICSMDNRSVQPRSLLAHGNSCCLAMFSRAKYLVTKKSALHVGQRRILPLHLPQTLWPFLHHYGWHHVIRAHRALQLFQQYSAGTRGPEAIPRT